MRIIITGISGFVGQNLSNHLIKNGNLVEGLSLREYSWANSLIPHFDSIIHLAGKAHDTSNNSNEEEYFKTNTDLTIELFELFLRSDIKDFFYFSSVKAVADSVDGVLYEDADPKPLTAYGKSKFEAEKYLLSKKLPPNKRLFIIRPCMIHGPGNKGNLNLLYNVVKKGIPWPLAKYKNERSFLSIDNLNFLIYSMIKNPKIASGIYNFSDDNPLSTNELVALIGNCMGKNVNLWGIPSEIIYSIAKFGDIFHLPLNSERLKKLTESYIVSNLKIKTALGIDSLPLTSKDGLIKTIFSFENK